MSDGGIKGISSFSGTKGNGAKGSDNRGRSEEKGKSEGKGGFVPPGLAKKGGLPPGIAKKMEKDDDKDERKIPENGRIIAAPAGPLTGEPVVQRSPLDAGINPINALNNSLFPNSPPPNTGAIPTGIGPIAQPPLTPGILPGGAPIGQPPGILPQGASPIINNPPAILTGVPEAFATGNPLAGPLQLVSNINQNSVATLRSIGLA
jgi:hypothetical protein